MLTDILKGVYLLADTIYTQKGLAAENKKRCRELYERLLRIEFSVGNLLTGSSDSDRYKVFLQPLEECLQACFEFLSKINPAAAEKSGVKKLLASLKSFGKARSEHGKFEQFYEKLGQIEADLTLALQSRTIHYLREVRKHQTAADKESASLETQAHSAEKEMKQTRELGSASLDSNPISISTSAMSPSLPAPLHSVTQILSPLSPLPSSSPLISTSPFSGRLATLGTTTSPSASTYIPPMTTLYQTASKGGSPLEELSSSTNPSVSEDSESGLPSALRYAVPSQTLYRTDAVTAITRPDSPGQESLKEKALGGDADAQNNLGDCYYHGKEVNQNYDKAFFWFGKAVAKAHTIAQFNLGNCFYRGHGTTQSYPLAVVWYTKAAEGGDKDAQNNLGNCFKKGRTGVPDLVKAREWFRVAASQGHMEAQFNYAVCLHNGEGGPRDEKTAVEWYRKAANQGSSTAKAYLGFCYEKGQGVAVDLKQAFDLYQQAADAQDTFGRERLKKLQKRQEEKSELKLVKA